MFTTLMIGNDANTCAKIKGTIEEYCIDVQFQGMASDFTKMPAAGGQDPDLIFWDARDAPTERHVEADNFPQHAINVLLLDQPLTERHHALRSTWATVQTCLYKPVQVPDLLITLSNGRSLVELRRSLQLQQEMLHKILDRQNNPGVVGIPTDQGMEFIAAKDILRCEGLNKYTLIVCSDGLQLVSSYNIGEFAKQLQPFSFFAPHKSHLVNLAFIKRLNCENQIVLRDGTAVPLSRRRRLEFLQRFRVDGGCH